MKVKTTTPIEGGRNHAGALVSADDDGIVVAADGGELRVRTPISRRPRTVADWDAELKRSSATMNAEMIAALRELEREKGIAFETILAGLEEAMASAYKTWWKQEHPDGRRRLRRRPRRDRPRDRRDARLAPAARGGRRPPAERGRRARHGDAVSEEEVEVTDEFKGRIGAQTAKQVIFQKLRDAEREMTYEEFAGREGDVVTGIVQQSERRYTLLDLGQGRGAAAAGRAGAVRALPQRRAPEGLHHRGPQGHEGPADRRVAASHPGLLKALFAMEVPEIEEGIVEIKAVAREPGHRSKIAVSSQRARASTRSARASGPKGVPRAHGRERAARREDRRGAVDARTRASSSPTPCSPRR